MLLLLDKGEDSKLIKEQHEREVHASVTPIDKGDESELVHMQYKRELHATAPAVLRNTSHEL